MQRKHFSLKVNCHMRQQISFYNCHFFIEKKAWTFTRIVFNAPSIYDTLQLHFSRISERNKRGIAEDIIKFQLKSFNSMIPLLLKNASSFLRNCDSIKQIAIISATHLVKITHLQTKIMLLKKSIIHLSLSISRLMSSF